MDNIADNSCWLREVSKDHVPSIMGRGMVDAPGITRIWIGDDLYVRVVAYEKCGWYRVDLSKRYEVVEKMEAVPAETASGKKQQSSPDSNKAL